MFAIIVIMKTEQYNTLPDRFWEPLDLALGRAEQTRYCTDYSDLCYLHSGVGRIIQASLSGREWVQFLEAHHGQQVSVSNFFAALNSERRLKLLQEIDQDIRQQAIDLIGSHYDLFIKHPELKFFDVYASDGHCHGASAHETPLGGKKRAITHLFSLNLQTRTMSHLTITKPAKGKKKEHEITAIKRSNGQVLRMGAAKKTKVIHAYDPAIIDYHAWHCWKQAYGIYIITREKSNSKLITIGLRDWDRDDSRNIGVLSDEFVESSSGTSMRRVRYLDPVTGKEYVYLTTEMTLPPGLIACIYKKRWDIEKVFDEIKNKLGQKQAWGKSETCKIQQALFITIAHNLMAILEFILETEDGIVDEKVQRKQADRQGKEIQKANEAGRKMNPLMGITHKATQRSLQFIRWLRYELYMNTPWQLAVRKLRPLMMEYSP